MPVKRVNKNYFEGGSHITDTIGTDLAEILDEYAAEINSVGNPNNVEGPTVMYIDTVNGNDANDGSSWAKAKKTEAAFEDVPAFGWTYIKVKGNLTIAKEPLPYAQFLGCLRIIGADDWTEIASGTVTSYTAGGGRFESNLFDLDLGVYSKADATDRNYFLEVTDDLGVTRTRKILEYDHESSGKYDVESPGSQTITGGNACRLVQPTTTITIADRISGPYGLLGSVYIVGCKIVTANKTYPIRHVGLSACEVDISLASYAAIMSKASSVGLLTGIATGTHGQDFFATMAEDAVDGTYLEGKLGPTARYPGCYIKLKGTTGQFVFGEARRNQWVAMNTVFDGGYLYFGSSLQYCNVQDCRGVATGIEVDNSEAYFQHVHFPDGKLRILGGGLFWHWSADENTIGYIDLHDGTILGYGLSEISIERSSGNVIGVSVGPTGFIEDTKITGGFDITSGATPFADIEGKTKNLQLELDDQDRGAGPLVLVNDGAVCHLGDTASGVNTNAGGHGLEVRNKALADLPSGHALTGDSGSETRMYLGSLGLTTYPASGNRKNDIPADPAGTEELVIVAVR